jgi:hypothetical protein
MEEGGGRREGGERATNPFNLLIREKVESCHRTYPWRILPFPSEGS